MSQLQEEGGQFFGHSWKAIPGLGMGHVTSTSVTNDTEGLGQEPVQGQPIPDHGTATHGTKRTCAEFEDGELSEGETDDVYEPEDVDSRAHEEPEIEDLAAPMDISNSSDEERELSYSPRLSPQERGMGQESTDTTDTSSLQPTSIDLARARACDTIRRLWPLGVRFHHFVEEGIDPGVLQELFEELGLDMSLARPESAIPVPATSQAAARQNTTYEPARSQIDQPLAATTLPSSSNQMSNPSESRKDRIARLLAAKGSKGAGNTNAGGRDVSVNKPESSSSATPLASKPKSDKSAILKEKMAALQAERARRKAAKDKEEAEALAKGQPQPAMADAAVSFGTRETELPISLPQNQERSGHLNIPGLSATTTSASPNTNYPKRPVATDFGDFSTNMPASMERSTERVGETKPFLIHVSDDDSDAEMDLDSPNPHVKSAFEGSFFKHQSSVSNEPPTRPLSTPGRAYTPNDTLEKRTHPNLEHMNRKIEEMRRRIAEAEAKKRAKESLAGSRTPNEARTNASRASSTGLSSEPSRPRSPAPAAIATTEPTSDDRGRPLSRASQMRQLDPTELRRSRSRAASERIPHLEARRREQMLRLQVLQSQVASIEKEIAASKEEEARLKEGVLQSDELMSAVVETSDKGATNDQSGATSKILPVAQASEAEVGNFQVGEADDSLQVDLVHTNHDHLKNSHDVAASSASGSVVETGPDGRASSVISSSNSAEPADIDTEMADATEAADPSLYEIPSKSYQSTDESDGDSSDESTGEIRSLDDEAAAAEVTTQADQDDSSSSRLVEVSAISEREATRGISPKSANSAGTSDPSSSFQSYESPLSYFRAYRFHPEFKQNVTGGLRSLTYSNHVDIRKPLCPDELQGQVCPRGDKCQFQHFDMLQLPDDQILVQLGAAASLDEAERQEYITGLRKLLTDFRSRKVRDFATISDGIIAYRANFHGDRSKILPLGGTSI